MSNGIIDPMTAILDQLAAHADQITRIGQRHDAGQAALRGRIDAVAALAAALDAKVTALARHLAGEDEDQDQAGYAPAPVRRWWQLSGTAREQAVGVLQGWVEQVYRPGYGQLAELLGACWDQHPLCLYGIDILAELWSVLYLPARRNPAIVSAQAEYQARILPALAEQMAAETARCHHPRDTPAPALRRTP
jgi:hypothetical protein